MYWIVVVSRGLNARWSCLKVCLSDSDLIIRFEILVCLVWSRSSYMSCCSARNRARLVLLVRSCRSSFSCFRGDRSCCEGFLLVGSCFCCGLRSMRSSCLVTLVLVALPLMTIFSNLTIFDAVDSHPYECQHVWHSICSFGNNTHPILSLM